MNHLYDSRRIRIHMLIEKTGDPMSNKLRFFKFSISLHGKWKERPQGRPCTGGRTHAAQERSRGLAGSRGRFGAKKTTRAGSRGRSPAHTHPQRWPMSSPQRSLLPAVSLQPRLVGLKPRLGPGPARALAPVETPKPSAPSASESALGLRVRTHQNTVRPVCRPGPRARPRSRPPQ